MLVVLACLPLHQRQVWANACLLGRFNIVRIRMKRVVPTATPLKQIMFVGFHVRLHGSIEKLRQPWFLLSKA